MSRRRPFQFVGTLPDHDAVRVLTQLLRQAQNGELIGMIAIPIYRRRRYAAVVTGEAERNAGFAATCSGVTNLTLLERAREESKPNGVR